ncbi:uncharacterized RNA-binding -like [Paramuricea clavata]|uniref:Uncharacterized RNA-binding -like n=1 Tax=Paramuricea clavata TaxID=317549 RepID=A0A6S7IKZ9_PARCT|nr:uncharacterized RNA-binding -like [Paramuricea clavata]
MSTEKMENIEPQKIFVKYLPKNITVDEIKAFFSVCGIVLKVYLKSLKSPDQGKPTYICAFITYGTQAGADRAVSELNHKEMKKGHISQKLSVMYSLNYEGRKELQVDNSKEKKVPNAKEYQELWLKCSSNAEKINQIYNKPEEQKQIEELRTKKCELQAKQDELKKTNNKLKDEINLLRLEVQIKNMDIKNTKLKEAQ